MRDRSSVRSLPEIRAEVSDALQQAGGTRNLVLSPGCNVSPGTALRLLIGMRDAVRLPHRSD